MYCKSLKLYAISLATILYAHICIAASVKKWESKEFEFQKPRIKALSNLNNFLFDTKSSIKTDSALIIYKGFIIYEKYANGYDVNRRHAAWSMSKSILNTLTGIAINKKKLQLNHSICLYFKEKAQDPNFCKITVNSLLNWTSGIHWKEDYEKSETPSASSVIQVLYGDGRANMAKFVMNHKLEAPPDTFWRYSSGDSLLLSALLKKVFSPDDNFLWTEIFDVLGMHSPVFEKDGTGVIVASSYLYSTPRDLAKWAYLYLKNGEWEDKQLFQKNWIASSLQVPQAFKNKTVDRDEGDVGGASFWLNKAVPEQNIAQPWPSAPADTFATEGHWGQNIFIIPSWDAIVLRFGNDRKESMDKNEFLKRVGAFLK